MAPRLAAFTVTPRGWMIRYKGRPRFVCGKTIPAERVPDVWETKKKTFDTSDDETILAIDRGKGLMLGEVATRFFAFNDTKVKTGKPKRMSEVTAWDYVRTLGEFCAVVGVTKIFSELSPADFDKYAAKLSKARLTEFARKVAYVRAFIRWAMRGGYFAESPILRGIVPGMDPMESVIGSSLVKPPSEDLRDERAGKEQSYAADELRRLWCAADDTERLWIAFGLNCAFDNSDLGGLPRIVIDRTAGNIDYRRRKRGRIRRVVPLLPALLELLDAYQRPAPQNPADADRVFLTPTGLPLQRLKSGQIDYVALRWRRLKVAAGLSRFKVRTTDAAGVRHERTAGDADGRGYRGLRTTFANLAPANYREEVEIVMGHARGTVLLDNYLERVGMVRLRELVSHVWHLALVCEKKSGEACSCDPKSTGYLKPVPVPPFCRWPSEAEEE